MYASTARRHNWSIISIAAGTIPAAITALTVDAPASTDEKSISIVQIAGGSGVSRTHTPVVTPSIPSLPTNTPRRSNPAGSGSSPPRTVTSPSGSTTSNASTWALVTPSARQCGPPELLATLPPIEHVCWLLGSGAKCSPCDATALVRSRLRTPGSTHARRAAGSTDSTRFIFVVAMTTAPSGGTAPPASPVPEPRATNGTPWRAAICTHDRTSSVETGKHTATAAPSMCEASCRYSESSVEPSRTRSAASAWRSSSTSAATVTRSARAGASGSPVPTRPARRR